MLGVTKLAAGVGNVDLVEREPAAMVPPGYARLAVRAAGICGTDLHIEADEFRSSPPVTMGHEVCGTVAELGDGVDGGSLGERVVSETYDATCGRCMQCREGRPNLCPGRRSIGSQVDGAFAATVVGPGAIGLLAAQVARASGGRVEVRGAPHDAARLAIADRIGRATRTGGRLRGRAEDRGRHEGQSWSGSTDGRAVAR